MTKEHDTIFDDLLQFIEDWEPGDSTNFELDGDYLKECWEARMAAWEEERGLEHREYLSSLL